MITLKFSTTRTYLFVILVTFVVFASWKQTSQIILKNNRCLANSLIRKIAHFGPCINNRCFWNSWILL